MFSVTLLLPCFLCLMHSLLHLYMFIHLHLASHLGTLDEPREGRAPIGMMEGLHRCCELGCRQDGAS